MSRDTIVVSASGPQGGAGPQGPQGIQGPTGPQGAVASVNGQTGAVTIDITTKAEKSIFDSQASGAGNPTGENLLIGTTSYVHPDAGDSYLFGAGHTPYENVIGGDTATVNTTTSNLPGSPPALTPAPSWNSIVGGYDNVVNGWACQVQGFHTKVEQNASHCTIGGGSYHTVAANTDYATIGGGTLNAISADQATIGGGTSHIASASGATVGGGTTNQATGANATVAGGTLNTATSSATTVAGGTGNDATLNYASIGGGANNTASEQQTTVAGGNGCTASGNSATVGGGLTNTASATGATVPGGRENTASGTYSVASGRNASATTHGQRAHAAGMFTVAGDAQSVEYVLRRETTSASALELFGDGASSTTRITVPADTSFTFEALIVARDSSTSDSKAIRIRGLIRRDAGTSTIVGTPTTETVNEDAAASTWSVAVAGNADGSLRFTATGEASKTVRWVARVTGVMVAG